jgi:hypothetical protein
MGLLALALTSTWGLSRASAAGYDTPILYTARHQAMGGTAIGYVSDPSAGFHNPAGLHEVEGLALIGDFSLLLGRLRATPIDPARQPVTDKESGPVIAPFFLLGAGYRVHEWLSIGLSVFPVASGGAEYEYAFGDNDIVDSTSIVFFEGTPHLSLNVPEDEWLPGELAIGFGLRGSLVMFERKQGEPSDPQLLDLELNGMDFAGFRAGIQYWPIEALKLGVVYRNKVTVETKADSVTVLRQQATDAALSFTLPSKLGFGARFDHERFAIASDVEWAFQSQNRREGLSAELQGQRAELFNVFEWQSGVTLRFGAEYRAFDDPTLPIRLGYIYDSQVTNRAYPSAFGTPPAATHSVTAGTGYVRETWQLNVAVARRFGGTLISEDELGEGCSFCSGAGDYQLGMTGLYIDASVDLPL